jgi:hypothetical protein
VALANDLVARINALIGHYQVAPDGPGSGNQTGFALYCGPRHRHPSTERQ